MSVQRGDVVLLTAPFASRAGAKTRPMLVVQNDRNNARMANTILVFITTNTSRIGEPTQVLVDLATPEGRASGLK
jgi:mRNA interferase MazF